MEVSIFPPLPPKAATTRKFGLGVQHLMPGDVITEESGFLRGHGTQIIDGKLVACVCGIVERVNKLIVVRPIKSRFQAEIGDVVVGRIVDVGNKKWRVDINAKQYGVLLLNSVNLPGGVQRRRTQEDELNMRTFFAENDLIVAEIQQTYGDGTASLHTRSAKYRRLVDSGLFLTVHPQLIKRTKEHFHKLPCGIDLILGQNGYIWMTETSISSEGDVDMESSSSDPSLVPRVIQRDIGIIGRENLARVRNSIVLLSTIFMQISPESIMELYQGSSAVGIPPKDMLRPDMVEKITKYLEEFGSADSMEVSIEQKE